MMSGEAREIPLHERTISYQLRCRLNECPDKVFMSFDDSSWTYREVNEIAQRVATQLKSSGVTAGDRVVLMLPNCPEFVFAWFGVSFVRATTVPIDPRQTGALLEYTLTDSMPRCIVIAEELLPALAATPPDCTQSVTAVVVVGDGSIDSNALSDRLGIAVRRWSELVQQGDEFDPESDYRDTGMIMYTSGSSGPAKGVIMPNSLMFASGSAMIRATDMRHDDVLFAPFPLFHGMSSRIGVLPALLMGARFVLGARFSVSAYWQQATASGATIGIIVPTLTSMLMSQPQTNFDRKHGMRMMFNSKSDPAFEERFGVELVESYGMTEISHVISACYSERRPGSAGKQQKNWDVKLVDEDGREVPEGAAGEIVVRPRIPWIMMEGYLNKPEQTAKAVKDGWFHTGDYGHFDKDGYFYFSGRKAERIRRLGENISAEQIEGIVDGHPDVVESVALPHPAPYGEDDIRLVIARHNGSSLDSVSLYDWLKDKLPRFMMPRYVEFVPHLPRTESGKVSKLAMIRAGLREGAWEAPQQPRGSRAKSQ